jgi:murein DD-endopeptidase MepM/ murein hydrolase activator NlpD
MGYNLPTNTSYVSDSWQGHKNRNPPSSEPGTDYGSASGSPLYAPGNGKVVDLKTSNTNATGRYLTIDLDDGRRTRSLHLAAISVSMGARVTQGQRVGTTGASANGSDWGVGAHVHQTLWATQAYSFCSTCTIDFAKYVGSSTPGPKQRVAGPDGANARSAPNTSGPATGFLDPGAVGDFDGWINGESVSGNKVWFRGEHSGDYYWSGGFTDKGTHDLADLNPKPPANPKNRTVTAGASANGRNDPSTNGPVAKTLDAGATTEMDGWVNGQTVESNKVWFREKSSQKYFWSGGFTDKGTHDLTDLNTPTPPPQQTRTVAGGADANIRDLPYTASPAIGASSAGEVVPVDAWTKGEAVSGNNVWFRRKADGDWSWSGGFTSQAVTGIEEIVPPPSPPTPPDANNPRKLPTYTPVYPGAFQGLKAPLGFTDCHNPVTPTPRDKAGSDQHPVDPVIDTYVIHWTATLVDQMDYFSYCNSRNVCPTFYMRRDGSVSEMIPPRAKPAATGPDWNWRSLATETLAEPGSDFTPAQWEAHAQIIAWLAGFDGKELDGVPVDFQIDRTHVLGHRECLPGQTTCPGDAQIAGLPALLARAREIYDEAHPGPEPEPGDGTLDPAEYPALFALKTELDAAFETE